MYERNCDFIIRAARPRAALLDLAQIKFERLHLLHSSLHQGLVCASRIRLMSIFGVIVKIPIFLADPRRDCGRVPSEIFGRCKRETVMYSVRFRENILNWEACAEEEGGGRGSEYSCSVIPRFSSSKESLKLMLLLTSSGSDI